MGVTALFLWTLGAGLAGPPSVNIGSPALQFTLPAVNEDTALALVNKPSVALSDFAGLDPSYPKQVVVLYFCTRDEGGDHLAALERLAKRFRGKDAQFVVIMDDTGDLNGLGNWIAAQNLSFPVLRDHHRVVASRYGITEWPLSLVIDAEGDIVAIGNPDPADLETELGAEVDGALGGKGQ